MNSICQGNRKPYLLRRSFSLIDTNTKQQYEDIKGAFLQARRINTRDALTGYIAETSDRNKVYYLQLDKEVQSTLLTEGEANCIISFQIREIPFSRGKQVFVAYAKLLTTVFTNQNEQEN